MDKKTDVRDPDEKVVEIEMERLRAFPNHPFKVIGDSQMIELQDSIKKYTATVTLKCTLCQGHYDFFLFRFLFYICLLCRGIKVMPLIDCFHLLL